MRKKKNLSYIPVGLGDREFSESCYTDKSGENISSKNQFYGEYTFHYWIWKNYLKNIKTEWVGFCQYRKFFLKENVAKKVKNFDELNQLVIKNLDTKTIKQDCILGTRFSVKNTKFQKYLKIILKNS